VDRHGLSETYRYDDSSFCLIVVDFFLYVCNLVRVNNRKHLGGGSETPDKPKLPIGVELRNNYQVLTAAVGTVAEMLEFNANSAFLGGG